MSEDYLFGLAEAIQSKEAANGYQALTPVEQVFFCVWTLEAELNNGGFDQFYRNLSGALALAVPNALRTIGALHTAELVEAANGVFGSTVPPQDQAAREDSMDDLDNLATERLEELDAAFLEYRDNLSELLTSFMKASAGGQEGAA